MSSFHSRTLWPALILTALLAGCRAAPAPSVGFADPKLLKPDPNGPFDKFWRDPSVDWSKYNEIYVADVNTAYMIKMTDWQKGEEKGHIEKDVKIVAEYQRNSLMKAFRDDPAHRFKVLDKPSADPNCLVYETALIELVPSKTVLNALGYAPFFVGTSITVIRTIGNDKSFAAFEARVRDASSGKIIMLAADREGEQLAIIDVRGLTWYSDAEGIIDDWSKEWVQVADKKAGAKVESTATFRLLPW